MREEIIEKLRERIVTLQLKPSDPINEKALAKEFNVSRTPAREALLHLAAEGLVSMVPNQGARVADLNFFNLREVIEYRSILESGSAALIVDRSTPKLIEDLNGIVRDLLEIDPEDSIGMKRHDARFHKILRHATGNQLLERQLELVHIKFIWLSSSIPSYTPQKDTIEEMQNIINAIQSSDIPALKRHLVQHARRFIEFLSEQSIKGLDLL